MTQNIAYSYILGMSKFDRTPLAQESQSDIAMKFGISQAYLSQILSGKRRPSLDLAIRIERLTDGAVPATSWVEQEDTAA